MNDTKNESAVFYSVIMYGWPVLIFAAGSLPIIVRQFFKSFLGINFDAINTIKMRKNNRQELLQSLVLYYELHLQGFRKPKSLAVLNEVFG